MTVGFNWCEQSSSGLAVGFDSRVRSLPTLPLFPEPKKNSPILPLEPLTDPFFGAGEGLTVFYSRSHVVLS